MTTFYGWLFGVLELELEFCNLFLIFFSKQRAGEARFLILVPVDLKFYWLLNDISVVRIGVLHFAEERHKVRNVMLIKACILASMKKLHMVEVWKKYIICKIVCELK